MARKVIGPTGSRRRRRWYLGTTLVVAAFFTVFVSGAFATTFETNSPSGFEAADGNMVLSATTANTSTDWNCFVGQGGFQAGTPDSNCKVTTGATQIWADGGTTSVGSTEIEQTSGQKFDTACPTFPAGNNPPKDEWSNIAEYTEQSTATNLQGGHDLYFYGATIRPVTNGNSSGNVYFSQSTTCRTVGDVLIAFDFVNGGGTPSLHSLRWIDSPATATSTANTCYVSSDQGKACWADNTAINTANYEGNVNTNTILAADNGISGTQLPANAFAEFGINLTQALVAAGITTVPCFAQQTWVSRSSGSSFSSNPEDVEIVHKPTCGSITIIKHTLDASGNRTGVNQDFSYTTTGGLPTDSTGFTLNDQAGCDPSKTCTTATNTQTFSSIQPGSYTVNEPDASMPANFKFISLNCTPEGTGTTAGADTTTATQADINLGFGGNVVCTYLNQKQLGALVIFKNSSKSGNAVLQTGATFCYSTTAPDTNNDAVCTATSGAGTVSDNAAASGGSSADGDTGTGVLCVANLPVGTYYVNETHAPTGYGLVTSGQKNKSVTVVSGTDCGTHEPSTTSNSSSTVTFTDPPLFDVIIAYRDGGSGETSIASGTPMACSADNNTGVDATTGTGFTTPSGWTTSDAIKGVRVTSGSNVTVTCTAVVDP
jgi:hypothetical protein